MGKKNWIEFDNQEKQTAETAKVDSFNKRSKINIFKQNSQAGPNSPGHPHTAPKGSQEASRHPLTEHSGAASEGRRPGGELKDKKCLYKKSGL